MERYETEEQQVEAIKRFWKENGVAIIVGAVIGLGGLYAWRWYNESQLENKASASLAYNEIVEQVSAGNNADVQSFISEYGTSGYGSLAGLISAQQFVNAKDLAAAEATLKDAVNMAKSEAIADLARLRLARVQVALEQYPDALTTLDSVVNTSFSDQVEELRGDIFVAQNEFDQARIAYTSVLAEDENNTEVKTKLSDIAYAATLAADVTSGE